jgi:hypothetical protein
MRRFQPAATSVFAVFRLLPPAESDAFETFDCSAHQLCDLPRTNTLVLDAMHRRPAPGGRAAYRPVDRMSAISKRHPSYLKASPTSGRRTTSNNAKPAIA